MSKFNWPPGFRPSGKPTPAPAPRPTPAPAPTPQVVIHNAPHVSASQALAVVFAVALVGLGAHDYLAHHHTPTPAPAPPEPKPTPITGKLWVTTIYDVDGPGPDLGQLEADPQMTEGVAALGGRWRNWPSNSKLVAQDSYDQFVRQYGLPTLILSSEDGHKVKGMKCPATATEVISALKDFKAGK